MLSTYHLLSRLIGHETALNHHYCTPYTAGFRPCFIDYNGPIDSNSARYRPDSSFVMCFPWARVLMPAGGIVFNRKKSMNGLRIAGILLIGAGALALAYGGFSFTKETHDIGLGALQISVDEKEYVDVPIWAGIGALVLGGILLVWQGKR